MSIVANLLMSILRNFKGAFGQNRYLRIPNQIDNYP